jgi:hypothetical protein
MALKHFLAMGCPYTKSFIVYLICNYGKHNRENNDQKYLLLGRAEICSVTGVVNLITKILLDPIQVKAWPVNGLLMFYRFKDILLC